MPCHAMLAPGRIMTPQPQQHHTGPEWEMALQVVPFRDSSFLLAFPHSIRDTFKGQVGQVR